MNPKSDLTAAILIEKEFSDLPAKALLEIKALAYEFIATQTNATTLEAALSEKHVAALKKHLMPYYRHLKFGRRDPERINAAYLRKPADANRPADEVITAKLIKTGKVASEADLQKSFEQMERERDRWQKTLPLIEFEAFQIKTQNEVDRKPRLTLGFREAGLQMLFRRARIRMAWADEEN